MKKTLFLSFILCVLLSLPAFAATTVGSVGVSGLDAPAAGKTPDFTAVVDGKGYHLKAEDENGFFGGVSWVDLTAGGYLKQDNTFIGGHKYEARVWIVADNGYTFDVYDGYESYRMTAAFNGRYAHVTSFEGVDMRTDAVVYYRFDALDDQLVRAVKVVDVDLPAPGQKPDTAMRVEKDNARVKSVQWRDLSGGADMSADSVFQSAHSYALTVTVAAADGYTFTSSGRSNGRNGSFGTIDTFVGMIAGERAEVQKTDAKTVVLTATYTLAQEETATPSPTPAPVQNTEIMEIEIDGVVAPQIGYAPVYSVELASDEYALRTSGDNGVYVVNGITWVCDGEGNLDAGKDVFEAGKSYRIEIHLVPVAGYKFSAGVEAYINGIGVARKNVYINTDQVVILYAFDKLPGQEAIKEVSLTVNAPKADELPLYRVETDSNAYAVIDENQAFIIGGVEWYDVGENAPLDGSSACKAGHTYGVGILLGTDDAHTFPTDAAGQPAVKATVNGKEAEVYGGGAVLRVQYVFDKLPGEAAEGPNGTDLGDTSALSPFGGEGETPFDCKGLSGCPQFTIFFEDAVPYDHYAHAAIDWAIIRSITNGLDESHFGPEASCTRGQVVTFLWRAAGCPEPTGGASPFADVTETDYFYKPVLWAVEKAITAGTSATAFSPNDTCSSAHIVTFLYRALGAGKDGWYEEAKAWASGAGLLNGTGLTVSPTETCPRMAVVTFLYRALGA